MFTSVGNYMCTFMGQNLCVCGFDASAGWQAVDYLRSGPKAMQGFEGPSVIVLDNQNHLWFVASPKVGSGRSPNPHSLLPNSKSENLWVQV
jgi:hypothetical protein